MLNLLVSTSIVLSVLSLFFINFYEILIIIVASLLIAMLFPIKKSANKKEIKKKRFFKIYIFLILSGTTSFFASFLIFVALYIIQETISFAMFKSIIKINKRKMIEDSESEIPTEDSIKNILKKLNENRKIGLKESTIDKVGEKISILQETMPINNVSEIFTSFVFWYIFKGNMFNNPADISDEYILLNLKNMNIIKGKNGFELRYKQKAD